jgi:hypothetical protein
VELSEIGEEQREEKGEVRSYGRRGGAEGQKGKVEEKREQVWSREERGGIPVGEEQREEGKEGIGEELWEERNTRGR